MKKLLLTILVSAPLVCVAATKPPSSDILDTTNSLYTSLSYFWPFLEGTGTTSAEKKASDTALFQAGASSPSWASDSEGPYIHCTSDGQFMTLTSTVDIVQNSSFTFAFGMKNLTSSNQTMPFGDYSVNNDYWWMHGGSVGTSINTPLTGSTSIGVATNDEANRHDYVWSFNYSGGNYTNINYMDGVTASTNTIAAQTGDDLITSIMRGYSGSGFSMIGDMYYYYIWKGRALTQADAINLNTNPYALLISGSASFTVTPTSIPQNHTNAITMTFSGTGTSWVSGSTVSVINSVTGTTTVSTITWTRSSATAATCTVKTGAGAGTYEFVVDGTTSSAYTVASTSLSDSPNAAAPDSTTTVTLTATGTIWLTDKPVFTINGAGNSISNITWQSDTVSSFNVTATNTVGTYTITDSSDNLTTSFLVANPVVYDLTLATTVPSFVQVEGGGVPGTSSIGNDYEWRGSSSGAYYYDATLRMRAKTAQIDLNMYLSGRAYRYAIDRVDQSTNTYFLTGNTSAAGYQTIASGLDSSTEHEYLISFGDPLVFVNKVRTWGGSGLIAPTAISTRPVVAFYGDSIMFVGTDNNDSTTGWVKDFGIQSQYQYVNSSIGSSQVVDTGQFRMGDITPLNPAPAVVYVLYGWVDAEDAVSTTTFETAYQVMISSFATALPYSIILCEKLEYQTANGNSLVPYSNAIQTAVNNVSPTHPNVIYRTDLYDFVDYAVNNLPIFSGATGGHFNNAQAFYIAQEITGEINGILANGAASNSR